MVTKNIDNSRSSKTILIRKVYKYFFKKGLERAIRRPNNANLEQ